MTTPSHSDNTTEDTDVTVLVKHNGRVHTLSVDTLDEDEIERLIDERFDAPGEYTYGIFDEHDTYVIPETEPANKSLTDAARQTLADINKTVSEHDKMSDFTAVTTLSRQYKATQQSVTIRYSAYDTDFSIAIDTDVFDSVPVSSFDSDAEARITDLFSEFTDDATYLGFDSSYASRGRRNPYVRVYGRVNRHTPTDTALHSISDLDCVETVLWSTKNLSLVPLHTNDSVIPSTESVYDCTDTVVVFTSPTPTAGISELTGDVRVPDDDLQSLQTNTASFSDTDAVTVTCFGRVLYGYDNTARYYAGLQTNRQSR